MKMVCLSIREFGSIRSYGGYRVYGSDRSNRKDEELDEKSPIQPYVK